jgi:hypothetical protein
VEAQVDGEQVVCSVTPPAVSAVEGEPAAEAAAAAAPASSEPEVIRRGKESDEA